jgi:hypothetical protein
MPVMKKVEPRDRIKMFFGIEEIISIREYVGVYCEYFDCIVRVTAPRTNRGWIEFAAKKSELEIIKEPVKR